MKILLLVAILSVASARVHKQKAPLYAADSRTAADNGKYLVVFKEDIADDDVLLHKQAIAEYSDNGTSNISIITHEWKIGNDFRGYAAVMDDQLLEDILNMKEVKFVEKDQISTALYPRERKESHTQGCSYQDPAPWGLERITYGSWNPSANNDFLYKQSYGSGVIIYVIDTGIDTSHPLFQGRALENVNFIANPPAGDPDGHGTHVAGTAMADQVGVARSAQAVGVRVLDANGSGFNSDIIAGINWVAQQAGYSPKIVANLSLGGGYSYAMNAAVAAAINAGVHVAVAAGNENQDACNVSPASESSVYTVAASDIYDTKASFSNYGYCVDIIAPGVDVESCGSHCNGCTTTLSGTSMASPHVAGVMAAVLSKTNKYDYNPSRLQRFLSKRATRGDISGFGTSTVNKLLFYVNNCL